MLLTEEFLDKGPLPDIPHTDSKIQVTAVDKVASIIREMTWRHYTLIQCFPLKR